MAEQANNWQKSFAPDGYRTVQPWIISESTEDLIAFLRQVFGAAERSESRFPDSDGRILHAEVIIGDSLVMLFDSKPHWPRTPAFLQTYVDDIVAVLDRAVAAGAEVVTEISELVPGETIARFRDPWGNLWWLFQNGHAYETRSFPVHEDPEHVYNSLEEAMKNIR